MLSRWAAMFDCCQFMEMTAITIQKWMKHKKLQQRNVINLADKRINLQGGTSFDQTNTLYNDDNNTNEYNNSVKTL